jgi:hypothetical protein
VRFVVEKNAHSAWGSKYSCSFVRFVVENSLRRITCIFSYWFPNIFVVKYSSWYPWSVEAFYSSLNMRKRWTEKKSNVF